MPPPPPPETRRQVTEVAYVESEELRQALAGKAGTRSAEDAPSLMSEEILRLVASAERSSEHPLAKVRSSLGNLSFSVS